MVGKAGGDVQVVNVHQHFYAAPPASVIAPTPPVGTPQRAVQPLTDVHREVLGLMEPLPKRTRYAVLDFMTREFGTRMVKELDPVEVRRVLLYVQRVHENRKREVTEHDFL